MTCITAQNMFTLKLQRLQKAAGELLLINTVLIIATHLYTLNIFQTCSKIVAATE